MKERQKNRANKDLEKKQVELGRMNKQNERKKTRRKKIIQNRKKKKEG